jgi:Zn-dependent oligopeptidase
MAADKAIEPGKKSTERYLPEKAWAKLSPEERDRTDEKKKRESRKGKQFVKNTERAKKARRAVKRNWVTPLV